MIYNLANFCAIISYDIARIFTIGFIPIFAVKKFPIKAIQAFWYVDILIMLLIPFYLLYQLIVNKINLFSLDVYRKNKFAILVLIPQIFSSTYKGFLVSDFKASEIALYSIITPFVSFLLAKLIFKNEKTEKKHLLALVFCVIGFAITKKSFSCEHGLSLLLLGYSFVNAVSVIGTRWVSKKRKLQEGILLENFIYAAQGLVLFKVLGGKTVNGTYFAPFDLNVLLSFPILIIAIFAISHHLLVIIGNQREEHTISIISKDIFKIFFVFLSSFIFFRIKPELYEILGFCVILFGMFFLQSAKRNRK